MIRSQKLKVKSQKYNGFTLIESLITLAILGIIASVAVNIFATVVQTYNKANILNELQQNGNHAIAIMEQKIRNADELSGYEYDSTCTGDCPDNSWIVIKVKNPEPNKACIKFGFVKQEYSGYAPPPEDPRQAVKNGYVYMQESTSSDCSTFGSEQILTNENETDPKRGINVAVDDLSSPVKGGLKFDVNTDKAPTTVKIRLDLAQGIGGSTRPQYQANLHLETAVSMRSYK